MDLCFNNLRNAGSCQCKKDNENTHRNLMKKGFEYSGELSIYFKDIKNYKTLSREEESELFKRVEAGDKAAFDEIIKSNLKFVVSVAKTYRSSGVPFHDLISEGNLGLHKAATMYNYQKGNKFISYAVWWIKVYIQQYIEQSKRNDRSENNIDIDDDEMKDIVGFKIKHINKTFDDELSNIEKNRNTLDELLSCLKEREFNVLKMYYGLNDTQTFTLDEIGRKMNISGERVRKIKDNALTKLRTNAMLDEGFFDLKVMI